MMFSMFYMPQEAHAGITTGLQGYWALEETSGTRVDSHGSNDLDLSNGTPSSATGKVGTAMQLVRADEEWVAIDDADQSGLDGHTSMTIQTWIYMDNEPANNEYYYYVGKYENALALRNYFVGLYQASNIERYFWNNYNGGETSYNPAVDHAPTTWYHIVWTYDTDTDDEVCLYINGTQSSCGATANSDALYSGASDFCVGAVRCNEVALPQGQRFFDGRIDEVALWNVELTDTQISCLYNSGNGVSYANLVSTCDPATGGAEVQVPALPILFILNERLQIRQYMYV